MSAMKTSPVAVALALLATFVLGTAFASPALAHDALKSSDPAKGAKVESLTEVRLTFSATTRFPNVIVRTADGGVHQDGKPVVDGPVVIQKVKDDLPPGEYVIAYRVVSSDGHPIEGEIPFTLVGSPEPPSASASTSGEASPPASESPSAAPVDATVTGTPGSALAAESADEPASSGGVPGWVWLVVGGLAGIGIGLFFTLRTKKQP
jgi:methionine-rich copper-binding protein CopC